MTVTTSNGSQHGAAALPPTSLPTKTIVMLADAAQSLFRTLSDLERTHKAMARARLTTELNNIDLLGLTVNAVASVAEDYRASG